MAIDTVDFYRRGHFAVDITVAMCVLSEMAINALHPFVHVN